MGEGREIIIYNVSLFYLFFFSLSLFPPVRVHYRVYIYVFFVCIIKEAQESCEMVVYSYKVSAAAEE